MSDAKGPFGRLARQSVLAKPAEGPRAQPLLATVAVCTYDRYALLGSCFAALARQTLPADAFEILVIDNTPDPVRSTEEAATHGILPNLRWLHLTTPGLSNARNVAMREARAPIIAYIDDDAVAEPEWIGALIEAFDSLGEAFAGVGGRVLPVFEGTPPAWLNDKLLSYLSVVDLGMATRALTPAEWVVGANIAYRVDALRRIGGFSPALGRIGSGISLMSNDETELAERLAAQGGAMGYAGRAVVHHLVERRRLSQAWFRRRMAWQAVSDYVRMPETQHARSEAAWRNFKIFLAHQPSHQRSQRALALEQETAAAMEWQMSAIYEAVTCLLSGTSEADD